MDDKLSSPVIVGLALIIYGLIFSPGGGEAQTPTVSSIAEDHTQIRILYRSLRNSGSDSRNVPIRFHDYRFTSAWNESPTATEFSFFLAIPAMIGASLLKLLRMQISLGVSGVVVLLTGSPQHIVVSTCTSAVFCMSSKNNFHLFGVYRIILGLLILILVVMGAFPEGVGV